jgi:signal transduction histidine kinase
VRLAPAGSEIVLAAGSRDGWGWVAVRDDGPGIEPADQPRVFDRFFHRDPGPDAGAGRPGENGGSGLGLAIVRQVVESHGGVVALHSVPGEGSTFVLWLPDRAALGDPENRRSPRPPGFDPLARATAR